MIEEADFEKMEDMDITELDSIINFTDSMALQIAVKTKERLKSLGIKHKQNIFNKSKSLRTKYLKQKEKMRGKFLKKKGELHRYVKSSPFMRSADKLTFVIGVVQLIVLNWVLGRYPHSFYYTYHTFFVFSMIFGKWVYYKFNGMHYYMIDFCYITNMLVIYYIHF